MRFNSRLGLWMPVSDRVDRNGKQIKPGYQHPHKLVIIDEALKYVPDRSLVVQAGAHVGQWPLKLAVDFKKVLCFEGSLSNYECCLRNVANAANIDLRFSVLGSAPGRASMVGGPRSEAEHYVNWAGNDVEVVTIDSFNLSPNLIMLDIEGAELIALEGAIKTIERSFPVIVLEDQPNHAARFNIPAGEQLRFLGKYGYRIVDRLGDDVIYVR